MAWALLHFRGYMSKTSNRKSFEKLLAIGVGEIKTSKAGVPHLVHRKKSVCYFGSGDFYRVFWPYPSSEQERKDFKDIGKLLEFIK